MTYTYTADFTDDTQSVRLRIGDTGTTAATCLFADEEIDYFITQGGSVIKAAILALRTVMVSKSLRAKIVDLNGYRTEQHALKDIQSVLESLEEEAANNGLQTGTLAITEEHLEAYEPTWVPDTETGIGINH